MAENDSLDKTSELYETFPFMEAFPFEEYGITLETEGTSPTELGISPILVSALGSFGTEKNCSFTYHEKETAFRISFYQEDVADVAAYSKNIKKLDSVAEDFALGLKATRISEKLEHVKRCRKFIKSLKLESLLYAPLNDVLNDLLDLHQVSLTSDRLLGLQRLNLSKIKEDSLTRHEKEAIRSFFDFQLHYARILLGIVIAVKIH